MVRLGRRKLRARTSDSHLLKACHQAERNSEPLQTPVAIVKKKRQQDVDALVVMRLERFREWFLC